MEHRLVRTFTLLGLQLKSLSGLLVVMIGVSYSLISYELAVELHCSISRVAR